MTRPAFVLRFLLPVIAPIAGAPGQLLVVSPGHPTHTLAVYSPVTRRVLRHRHVEDGALYGPLLILDADGAVEFLTPQDQQTAHRLAG